MPLTEKFKGTEVRMEGDCSEGLCGGAHSKQALFTSIRNEIRPFVISKPKSAERKGKDFLVSHFSWAGGKGPVPTLWGSAQVDTFLEGSVAVMDRTLKVATHFDSESLRLEMHPVEVAKGRHSFIYKDVH